jgi:hypothetical protein
MTDLALSLRDLPPKLVGDLLALLEGAYAPGDAIGGVVLFTYPRGVRMGEITVSDTEANLTAKVTALDAEGHETTFDATPTWESSDDAVAHVEPSADGYSATFAIGQPGSAIITVTGIENSSGEDVEIVSTGLINVTAGDAVVGSIEFAVGAEA